MEGKKKHNFLRAAVFIIILFVSMGTIGNIFIPYNIDMIKYRTFYKTEENSLDVMIIGSSTLYMGLSPLDLWNDYGIVAHTLGSSVQAPEVTYYNVKEAFDFQSPKVVVLGITSLFDDYDENDREPFLRHAMDLRPLSLNKLEAINNIVKESNGEQSFLSYLMPLLRFHSRWTELNYEEIKKLFTDSEYMHGQRPVYIIRSIKPRDTLRGKHIPEEHKEGAWEFYKKSIDYCKEKGAHVVVIAMPDHRWTYGRYLTAKKLMEENDVLYIDLNYDETIKQLDVDWNLDFWNKKHFNPRGAKKATKYLGKVLKDNFEIPDRSSDETVKDQLDEDMRRYESDMEKFQKKIDKVKRKLAEQNE